jgi:hypothetical protein
MTTDIFLILSAPQQKNANQFMPLNEFRSVCAKIYDDDDFVVDESSLIRSFEMPLDKKESVEQKNRI